MVKDNDELINIFEKRFKDNIQRHVSITWDNVLKHLISSNNLIGLKLMEETGGEPDVVKYDDKNEKYIFYDCSKETPSARRSLCYDKEALDSRVGFKPKSNVLDMTKEMGIELLNEEEYMFLQSLDAFDLKTSSWILTNDKIRELGGAIFGDRRFDRVFIYHNGAESYYANRGFRGKISI
jgi:hypothetical protein